MTEQDIAWIKVNVDNWDAPDAPLQAPALELYDATALAPVEKIPDGATRMSATCPACICTRRKHRLTTPHTLIWGECIHATPPPPKTKSESLDIPTVSQGEVTEVVEEDSEKEELRAAKAIFVNYPSDPLKGWFEKPHACMALSEAATWGSVSDLEDHTEAPSSDNQLSFLEESDAEDIDFDDEFDVHGGAEIAIEPQEFNEDQEEEKPAEDSYHQDEPDIGA